MERCVSQKSSVFFHGGEDLTGVLGLRLSYVFWILGADIIALQARKAYYFRIRTLQIAKGESKYNYPPKHPAPLCDAFVLHSFSLMHPVHAS